MAQLHQTFPTPSPSAIASYSYTDIAAGTGMTQLYLFSSTDSVASDYHLGGNVVYSSEIPKVVTTAVDFDLSRFNLPKDIKGTAIFQLCYLIGGASGSAYATCKLQHVRGVSVTDIVTVITPTKNFGVSGVMNLQMVVPHTHFKKGDILRLNIDGTSIGNGVFNVYIDPKSRASAPVTITNSNIFIPFRIDL